jgi:hypothetical protein
MEWQLSGGDAVPEITDPRLTEEEEIERSLEQEDDEDDGDDHDENGKDDTTQR